MCGGGGGWGVLLPFNFSSLRGSRVAPLTLSKPSGFPVIGSEVSRSLQENPEQVSVSSQCGRKSSFANEPALVYQRHLQS